MSIKYVENGDADKVFYLSENKKNIFLIGDSIREGYCEIVKNEFLDKADVFYVNDNCRSTQYVIFSIKSWWNMFDDPDKVDIVHFNCGHWDTAHFSGAEYPLTSEEEYAKNLRIILFLIRKFFKNAKIVFATTTPMNPDDTTGGGKNPRSTEQIKRYNEIACSVMTEQKVEINDLFTFACEFNGSCYTDACHFTDDTNKLLGREVSRVLKEML